MIQNGGKEWSSLLIVMLSCVWRDLSLRQNLPMNRAVFFRSVPTPSLRNAWSYAIERINHLISDNGKKFETMIRPTHSERQSLQPWDSVYKWVLIGGHQLAGSCQYWTVHEIVELTNNIVGAMVSPSIVEPASLLRLGATPSVRGGRHLLKVYQGVQST